MKGHIRKRGNRWNIFADIARFVRFAKRRKAGQGGSEDNARLGPSLTLA